MAKKPTTDATTRVRILQDGVHSGEEDRTQGYKAGDLPLLPRDLADILIAKGLATVADESSVIQAAARGKKLDENAKIAARKSAAVVAQIQFDDLPPEVRALAREHGDAVVDLYQSGETIEDLVRAFGPTSE